jgi:hypothetical protein
MWCEALPDATYGYGVGWGNEGDVWATYANDGMDAGNACCACGGGTSSGFNPAVCEKDVNDPMSFFDPTPFNGGAARTMLCGTAGWGQDKCGEDGWHSDFFEPNIAIYNDIATQPGCAALCIADDLCQGFQHKEQHSYCELFKKVKFTKKPSTNKKWFLFVRNTFC